MEEGNQENEQSCTCLPVVARKIYNSLTEAEQKLACEAVRKEIEEWDEDEEEYQAEMNGE